MIILAVILLEIYDNYDGNGSGITYGANPPAFGIVMLKGVRLTNPLSQLKMTSLIYFSGTGSGGPTCEADPSNIYHSYNFMRGYKRDSTEWVIPLTSPPVTTKKVYPGDPESMTGWTEYLGRIENCGRSLTGYYQFPNPGGDRCFVLSSGSDNLTVNPGDTQVIYAAQLMARGTNNKNSVTLLKQLADVAQQLYNSGFIIGIQSISNEVPLSFKLYQNYPNPFNPKTIIRFDISSTLYERGDKGGLVKLFIYNILGQEIATIVNESLKPGTYEVEWDGSNYPSGVYYYTLDVSDPSSSLRVRETRRMVLIK